MAGGGLKVGDVYVVVSAAIGEFSKSMEKVLKTVESTAKRVKEAAKGIGEVGAIFAAGMGAALLASADMNAGVRADLQRLKDYFFTFAAQLGDALAPYLRQIADAVGRVLAAFQRLPPGMKSALAQGIAFMAAMGGVGMAVSKAAGLVEGLAKTAGIVLVPALNGASKGAKLLSQAFKETGAGKALLSSLKGMEAGVGQAVARMAISFAGLLLPILAVVAAIALVALAAGAAYEAWNDSSSGFKESVLSIWESIKGLGQRLLQTLSGWWNSLQEVFTKALRTVLELVAHQVRSVAKVLAPLARGLKLEGLASSLEDLQELTGEKLLGDLKSGAAFLAEKASEAGTAVVDAGKKAGEKIVAGVNYGARGLKRMWSDSGAPKWLGKLEGMFAGGGPTIRLTAKDLELSRELFDARMKGELKGLVRDLLSGLGTAEVQVGRVDTSKTYAGLERERTGQGGVFGELRRQGEELARAAAQAVAEVRASLVDKALGSLGTLGTIIQDAMQYAAGGPWAVIAAIAIDLLSQSEGFKKAMEVIEGIIQMVADALGQLFSALMPLLGAVGAIVQSVLPVLTPIFDSLAKVLEPLAPPLMIIANLLVALMPVLTLVIQAVMLIINPLQLFAGPVMKGLFGVLKFVSLTILRIVEAVAKVWNGIVGAIQSVLKTIADFEIFGAHPLGFLDDWADSLDGARLNTDEMAKSIAALEGLTWDAAKAKAEEIAETIRNRDALKDVNEQLSNVPRGFKIALERFRAQDPVTGIPLPSLPTPPPTVPPPASRPPPPGVEANPGGGSSAPGMGERFGGLIQWGDVTITGVDPQQALQQLERTAENLLRRVLGNRGAMFPFGAGGG